MCVYEALSSGSAQFREKYPEKKKQKWMSGSCWLWWSTCIRKKLYWIKYIPAATQLQQYNMVLGYGDDDDDDDKSDFFLQKK